MADHLRLPPHTDPQPRRRLGGDPDRPPLRPNRGQHATTLRGRLEGLGLAYGEALAPTPLDDGEHEVDSRIVLVFTGVAPLVTGPFKGWKMTPLSETGDMGMAVLTAEESRRTFARLVEQYGGDDEDWNNPDAWRTQLDAIDGVRLYDRQDRLDPRLEELLPLTAAVTVDASIWPSTLENPRSAQRVVDERVAELEALVDDASKRDRSNWVAARDRRPETPLIRVAANALLLEALLEHPLVERVTLPRTADVTFADIAGASAPSAPATPVGAPVGIIDDLVMDNPYLQGVIAGEAAFPAAHAWNAATQHGTQVAGVAAFGGLRALADHAAQLPTPHPLFSARILHGDPYDPQRATVAGVFHLELEAAIRWLASQGVKVINLSVNDSGPPSRAQPDEATAVIDKLVRELNLVIVVATGNRITLDDQHWLHDYPTYLHDPAARVAEPGTAALAVTTGAISWFAIPGGPQSTTHVAIGQARQAAPFTRVGPTRGTTATGTRKPEFVAHGGNWAWSDLFSTPITNDPALGVITLVSPTKANGRLIGTATGTSFAAPYVAHEAAEIATRYPDAGANLIRCLLALSAEPLDLPEQVSAYGMPRARSILESGAHRVILTFEGQIPPNHTLVHPVPVPADFARGRHEQQITIALAYDPPVRRTRRTYQGATMDIDLVRNMQLAEVVATFQQQPTRREVADDPTLTRRDLPKGRQRPSLEPGSQAVASNTLIRRSTRTAGWDPDDEGYFVVVRHDLQSWAGTTETAPQSYAVAVELAVQETVEIDLYARVKQELRSRGRVRGSW